MARIGLYLYIVVLYQNGDKCLLRTIMGPVREKRRGLLWAVAVPAERCVEWALCHLGLFSPRRLVPLIVRSAKWFAGYFAKYNGGISYIIYMYCCNEH